MNGKSMEGKLMTDTVTFIFSQPDNGEITYPAPPDVQVGLDLVSQHFTVDGEPTADEHTLDPEAPITVAVQLGEGEPGPEFTFPAGTQVMWSGDTLYFSEQPYAAEAQN